MRDFQMEEDMNIQTKVEVPRFNAMAAYEQAREQNHRLYDLLERSLISMECMADRLERRGEDQSHTRRFIASARKERLQ